MAWLHNLAGKAEDLLNKIDQNAATVLNETNIKSNDAPLQSVNVIEPDQEVTLADNENNLLRRNGDSQTLIKSNIKGVPTEGSIEVSSIKDNESVGSEKTRSSYNDEGRITFTLDMSRDSSSPFENLSGPKIFEREYTGLASVSESMRNGSQITDEFHIKYEEKISSLEQENQELNKQLLNLQHLFKGIQNDNTNLQNQVERANESVKQAQYEMEQYKARAQRILQEREKMLLLKTDPHISQQDLDIALENKYNEELRKEIEFQKEINTELTEKINSLKNELSQLQNQFVITQNQTQDSKQTLLDSLSKEKKKRLIAEEECLIKSKELQTSLMNLSELQSLLQKQGKQIEEFKEQLKVRSQFSTNEDIESRLHTLTQTLMVKQSSLETITSERNALRIQLEKLEAEFKKLQRAQKSVTYVANMEDPNDAQTNVPKLMVVSPFDVGMKRRVKETYSTFDTLSIRTGIFLRRYPLARIFVFSYMILLHVWVLIILWTYIPSTR